MSTLAADPRMLELVASSAEEAEGERALTSETVAALRDAGIFKALVPVDYGGGEVHPADLRNVIEEIAAADGAAGWIAAVQSTAGLASAYLPEDAARELFASPDAIAAGVFAPLGKLTVPNDGDAFGLSGRWPLGSGVSHSTIVGLGCIDPEQGPRYAVVGGDQVEVLDTWDSLGLRATASHDVEVHVTRIPADRIVDLIGGSPTATGPLYAFPLFGLLAVCISAVCTGIARGALDDVIALAAERKPAGSSRSVAERATTQERVAEATASVRAAGAGVEASIATAWSTAESGAPLSADDRAGLRLASTHAAQAAVGVVGACHRLGGARALYRGSTLERRQRDVHTAAQHMIVAPPTLELAGRVLLGMETDTSQL